MIGNYWKVAAVLVGSLALSGATYAYKKSVSSHEVVVVDSNGRTTVLVEKVKQIPMLDLDLKTISTLPQLGQGRLRLMIFLSGSDCGSCMTIIDQANMLAKVHSSQLEVDTIFIRSSESEAAQVMNSIKPRFFKVYLDTTGTADLRLQLPLKTPLAVLVDPDYSVKIAEGATTSEAAQQGFVSVVGEMADQQRHAN